MTDINNLEWRKLQPRSVNDVHNNDDVDSGSRAHHHTLGTGVNQAARGSDLKILRGEFDTDHDILTAHTVELADHESRIDSLEVVKSSVTLTQTVAQTIGTSPAVAVIDLDSVFMPLTGAMLQVDLANNLVKALVACRVRVHAAIAYAANATGYRRVRILKNGAAYVTWPQDANAVASLATVPETTTYMDLAVNDTVSMEGLQSSGANLNTAVGTYQSYLTVEVI